MKLRIHALSIGLSAGLALALTGCPDTNMRSDAGTDARVVTDAFVPPGSDASLPDAFVPGVDAGAVSCAPMNASALVCPGPICDGLDPVVWDGERCVQIDCGTCVGADCGRAYRSMAECTAAQHACVPELCRSTGGDWLFWAEECLHYRCGVSVPAECLVGQPVCNCGALNVFDPVRGCIPDPTCVGDDPPPDEILCTSTGGRWEGVCGPSHCGTPSPLACAALACTCGPLEVWDRIRGCVESSECHTNREVGQGCSTDGSIRCQDRLVCCQSCGGAGCFGDPTCRMPTCDPSGVLDTCGNNRMAP